MCAAWYFDDTDALIKREQFAISLRKQKKQKLLAAKRRLIYDKQIANEMGLDEIVRLLKRKR